MRQVDETLGDRLKSYERKFESIIKREEHIIVRIDGHKFSKFTKGFKKPFDNILTETMRLTTIDLLEEFQAVTGYTQSDEITLILKSKAENEHWNHIHKGRIQKISSLIAGFTTMTFNKYLSYLIQLEYKNKKMDVLHNEDMESYEKEYAYIRDIHKKIGQAWFDTRIYGVDSDIEAFNSVLWRVRDSVRNSHSVHAQTYCSHSSLDKKNSLEQSEYCLKTTGEDWNKLEDKFKYGILVKKEKYLKNDIERSRYVSWSENLTTFSEDKVELIINSFKI